MLSCGEGPEGASNPTRDLLLKTHRENASLPIRQPDQYGGFPTSWFEGFFGESLLVVVDANVLRNDIARVCRSGQRTVLITAANSGALRLFCAEHVIEEVNAHAEEWAEQTGVSIQTYAARWTDEYLPLIHVVNTDELLPSILSPVESKRVKLLLASKDPPSVALSLALGALFLTEDRGAWAAAYGEVPNSEELRAWLSLLKDGGDAGELGKLVFASAALPAIAVNGMWDAARWLYQKSPWLVAAIAVGLALLAARTSAERYRRMGAGLATIFSVLSENIYGPYYAAMERFRRMSPAVPSWESLRGTNDRRAVLLRACVHRLARAPSGNMSAMELANALPDLGVGQGVQLVRETLRSNACFHQTYAGRWQVGVPWAVERQQSAVSALDALLSKAVEVRSV